MSIKLAKDEVIVKQYDYSKTQSGALGIRSHLIVTNKRVIEEKVCDVKRNERVVRSEMPIDRAQYVKTKFRREGNFAWLIMALIGIALMMMGIVLKSDSKGIFIVLGLIVAALGFILFVFVRKSTVTCTISSDKLVVPTLALTSSTRRLILKHHVGTNNDVLAIKVNPEVAFEMVNELGAVILEAQNYVAEEAVEAEPAEAVAE